MSRNFEKWQREVETGNLEQVADLQDWAVRTIRSEGIRMGGINSMDMTKVYAYELPRIESCVNLVAYIKVRRSGARYLMSRKLRKAFWTLWAANKRLRHLGFNL